MKSTRFVRALLGLFYLLVPVVFLQFSFQRSFDVEQARLTLETRRRLELDMELVRRERRPEVLLTYDASRLIQALGDGLASESATAREGFTNRELAGLFHHLTSTPAFRALSTVPCEVTLCRVASFPPDVNGKTRFHSRLIYRCGKRLGLSPLAASLSLLLDHPIGLLPRSVDLRRRLRSVLPVPSLLFDLFVTANQRFHLSRGAGSTRGFLWARINIPNSTDRLFLQITADLTRLDEAFSSRHLARTRRNEGFGIAFLPRHPGSPRISTPLWEAASPWRTLPGHPFAGRQPPAFVQDGNLLIRNERLAPDDRYDVSLLRRIPLPAGGNVSALRLTALGLLFCLGLWWLVETIVFERGPELTFALRMGGVFLLASLLPLSGTQFLGFETFRQGRQTGEFKARRDLRQRLERIDSGFRDFSSQVLRSVAWHSSRPEFLHNLQRAEATFRQSQSTLEAASLTRHLQARLLSPPKSRKGDVPLVPIDALSLILVGPNQFFSACNRVQQGAMPQIQAFYGTLGTLWLNTHNPLVERDESAPAPQNKLSQGVIEEYGIELLLSFFGSQSFLDILFQTDRLFIMNSGIYQTYFALLGIRLDGAIRFLFLSMFGSERIENPYLEKALLAPRAPDDPHLFCVDLSTKLSIPEDIASWTALSEVRTRIADTRLPYSGRDASGTLLIEGIPGRQITRAAFIGALPAAPFDREMSRRRWLFGAGVLLSLLLAVLMSAGASIIFVRPIRILTAAVERISHGDYSGGIRLQGGPAEFEALGQAFNGMCDDLRTGKALGRFVSEGVRRAARDGNLELLAGEASESRITVLFCGIAGFKTLRRHRSPAELVTILDRHLSRVSTNAAHVGGEIDKMVGDKVMVVFDHARFPSARSAVDAALGLARGLARKSHGDALPLAIGINSGPALSGILGSPSFRLDYTVIGDTVNLAARLAEIANSRDGGGIIISGQTLALAVPGTRAKRLPIDSVRGKTREVEAWALEPREKRGTQDTF